MENLHRYLFRIANHTDEDDTFIVSSEDLADPQEGLDIYLCKQLSQRGKHAYAAICACFLRDMFGKDYYEFCIKTLDKILNHLGVARQVYSAAQMLVVVEVCRPSMWRSVLASEPILNKRIQLLLEDLIGLALMDGEYDARWRVLILEVAKLYGIAHLVEHYESKVTSYLIKDAKKLSDSEKNLMRKKTNIYRIKRWALITGAAAASAAILGLTGGWAAPAIVEGIAGVAGTSAVGAAAVTALSTSTGTAFIASLFGTAGATLVGYKMTKRVGDVKDFGFGQMFGGGLENNSLSSLVEKPHLSTVIAVSGWIQNFEENNFCCAWKRLLISQEQYYLRYESSTLYDLGQGMAQATSVIVSKALSEPFKFTILKAFMKGVTLPSILLGLSSIIDLPWSVSCSKAVQVGKQLAEVLVSRAHGRRPVSLIGFSIGARVIYYCLQELIEREDVAGIIEDVYLIGAPCPAHPQAWIPLTRVVSGTIVNAYSRSDNLLRFLYRLLSLPAGGVAGLQPIEVCHRRIKNVDVSNIISGHSEYGLKLNRVLKEMDVRLLVEQTPRIVPSTSSSPLTFTHKEIGGGS